MLIKGFSTFSGIGGFELGFKQAGIPVEWVGFSEIDAYARRIYDLHFSHTNYGDITSLDPQSLPEFELLTGGFPCQSFSTAGKRGGLGDRRGALFFDLARLIRHARPRFFLLENVKGLLFHDKGRTFRTVLETLADLGYGVQWQVLDSAHFGVPQHRERIFLAGHRGDQPGVQVFPLTGAFSCPEKRMAAEAGHSASVVPILTPRKRKLRPGCRRFKRSGEPMFTLLTHDRHGIFDGARTRILTPLEYERLQGFPDGWTQEGKKEDGSVVPVSDTQRYKCLGNAVTVPVVSAVARAMFPDRRTRGQK